MSEEHWLTSTMFKICTPCFASYIFYMIMSEEFFLSFRNWVALDQRILLSTYSFVVLLDDAAASSAAYDNPRWMLHIPNHTRQYIFRAKARQKMCQPVQVPSFVQKSAAAGG